MAGLCGVALALHGQQVVLRRPQVGLERVALAQRGVALGLQVADARFRRRQIALRGIALGAGLPQPLLRERVRVLQLARARFRRRQRALSLMAKQIRGNENPWLCLSYNTHKCTPGLCNLQLLLERGHARLEPGVALQGSIALAGLSI